MVAICFKIDPCEQFPAGLSDRYEADFNNVKAAKQFIDKLQRDPGSVGAIDAFRDATMWVVNARGDIVS